MLKSYQETTTWIRPEQPTAPAYPSKFIPPASRRKSDACTNGSDTIADSSDRAIDGVRIFDGISPLQRANYYSHSLPSRLEVLQTWEGVVTDIDSQEGVFVARLYDLIGPSSSVKEAEFYVEDVSHNDRDLLKVGGIFRWMIGYRRHSYGQKERVSAIIFRRIPAWTENDINLAMEEGKRLAERLVVE